MKSNYRVKRSRRYYLHRKVRDLGYDLDVKNGSISLPANREINEPPKYLKMLMDEFGYNIQLTIQ